MSQRWQFRVHRLHSRGILDTTESLIMYLNHQPGYAHSRSSEYYQLPEVQSPIPYLTATRVAQSEASSAGLALGNVY